VKSLRKFLLCLLLALFFIQLGNHFWPDATLVLGRRIDYLSPTVHLFDLVIIALFSINFPLLWSRSWFKSTSLIFFAVWVVMLVFSQFPQVIFFSGLRWLLMLLLLTVIIVTHPNLRWLQQIAAVCVICAVLLALTQFLGQHSVGGWMYWLGERSYTVASSQIAHLIVSNRLLVRPYATFSHPNVLGGVLVTLLPLFLFFTSKTRSEFLLIQAARVFTVFGIILSFSRAAWFVGTLIIVFSILQLYKTKKSLIFILLVIFGLFIYEELSLGQLVRLTEFGSKSVAERQLLAQNALRLITKQPLTGYGFGHFIPLLPMMSVPPFLLQPVHSVYLLAAVEVGLLATAALVLLLFRLLWRLRQLRNHALFWSISAILLLGLVDHYFWSTPQPLGLATLLIGLGLAETKPSALQ